MGSGCSIHSDHSKTTTTTTTDQIQPHAQINPAQIRMETTTTKATMSQSPLRPSSNEQVSERVIARGPIQRAGSSSNTSNEGLTVRRSSDHLAPAASQGNLSSAGTSSSFESLKKKETEKISFDGSIRKFLHEHVLFKNMDEEFISQLNNAMQSRIYSPNEYVIRKWEVGRAMFFILRGEVEVVSEDGETILNVMKEQSFFGEIGVLFSVPRTASCRARGRCIILALTKEKLQKVLEDYPKIADAVALIAEERFQLHIKQQESQMKVEFGDEIKIGMTNKDLKNIPLFRDCEIGFLHMLALSLKPVQFHYGDIIIHKGDIAGEMYFVVEGTAEVFSEEDGRVFAHFQPGTFFGEVGLFFKIKRIASVRCVSAVLTVFKLAKKDLDNVLLQYPEINEKIKIEAKQRFEYNKLREVAKLTGKQEVETDIEVIREKLKSIPLFRGGSSGFYHELALALKLKVYQHSDLIIERGQQGNSMYFVIDGTAEVVSDDGTQVFGELPPNSFFGEVALFFEVNRTASVRARTVCTVFELVKDALKVILNQHTGLKAEMEAKAEENYRLWQLRQSAIKQISKVDYRALDIEATVDRLKKVPIFLRCPANLLHELATNTSVHSYTQNDIIVKTGDPSAEMYLIVRGSAEIVSDDGNTVFDVLKDGDFFGEVGLIRGMTRTASVRVSSETCDLILLTRESLDRVLNEYPESYQVIALEADKRFQLVQTRRLAEERSFIIRDQVPAQVESVSTVDDNRKDMKATVKSAAKPPGGRSSSFGQLFKKRGSQLASTIGSGPNLTGKDTEQPKDRRLADASKDLRMSKDTMIDQPLPQKFTKAETSSAATTEKHHGKLGKMFKNLKNTFTGRGEKTAKVQPLQKDKAPTTIVADTPKSQQSAPITVKHVVRLKAESILDILDSDLAHIFSYLNPQDRVGLRLICRRFSTVLSDARAWSHLDFKHIFTTTDPERFTKYCDMGAEYLSSLNLHSCWQVTDDELRALVNLCPNLTQLYLPNCWKVTDLGLSYVAAALYKLKELDLSYCGQLNGSGFIDHRWASLKKLNLTYCKQIGDAQLEKILCRTTDISDLRLKRCNRITDFGVFLVVRYCRQLSTLDISDCEQISDKCLKWIASSCVNLIYLNLRFCTRITDGGLYDLSLGCQSFQALDLSHCVSLTDAAIVYFSESIKKLRSLKLRRCRKITDGVATYLMKAAPCLKFVDMTGCLNITLQAKLAMQLALPGADIKIDIRKEGGGKFIKPSPEERGQPVACEVRLEHVFWSGPADKIRIPLENVAVAALTGADPTSVNRHPSPGSNRKKGVSSKGGAPPKSGRVPGSAGKRPKVAAPLD